MNTDKIEAIKTARKIIAARPVYLDTETTGLDSSAEIVDIAVIDHDGTELMNTLIRPMSPIPEQATNIHGIRNEDVFNAPTFADILPDLAAYENRLIVIYNQDYDFRLIFQSSLVNDAVALLNWDPKDGICAMKLYAQFYGDWNEFHQSYRWQKQSAAAKQLGIKIPADLHRAAADANLCRLIIEAMAATKLPGEEGQLNRDRFGQETTKCTLCGQETPMIGTKLCDRCWELKSRIEADPELAREILDLKKEIKRSSQLFIETFGSMADHIHSTAKRKGFREPGQEPSDERMILLMHSELSEAVEAIRHGNPPDDKIPEFNGCEAELADCIIRIMDMAIARNLRMAEAIVAKMKFNETRPYKHGKEF